MVVSISVELEEIFFVKVCVSAYSLELELKYESEWFKVLGSISLNL